MTPETAIAILALSGLAAARLAAEEGRDPVPAGLLGLLTGPLALALYFVAGPTAARAAAERAAEPRDWLDREWDVTGL